MPTLNIKDPEVYRLAAELAQRREISMTAAVRAALEETLTTEKKSREGIAERLMEIGRRSKHENPEPFLTDDDLYDEWGLPK